MNAKDPLEGERLLLALEFDRLDELVGLHSFDDCALYGYALKLRLLERQRVFRHDEGKAAFDTLAPGTQRALLEAEGVAFRLDGTVDLEQCLWTPES